MPTAFAIWPPKWRISFRVTVVGLFFIITTLTATVAVILQYHFSIQEESQSALSNYKQAADRTKNYLTGMDREAKSTLKILSTRFNSQDIGLTSKNTIKLMAAALRAHPSFYAIYFGFSNGNLYDLVNLDSGPFVRKRLKALPNDRWLLISVTNVDGRHMKQYIYYDARLKIQSIHSAPSSFYSTNRPWYSDASPSIIHKTQPYLFQFLQRPGQTYSISLHHGIVLAADVTLAALSKRLSSQLKTPGSQFFLYRPNGQLIASNVATTYAKPLPKATPLALTPKERAIISRHPVLTVSNLTNWPPFDYAISGQPRGYSIDVLSLISQMTGLKFHFINGSTWPDFLKQFRHGKIDILESVLRPGHNVDIGNISTSYAHAPFGIITRQQTPPIHNIKQLFNKRLAIPAGWSINAAIHKDFPKIKIVRVKGVDGMFSAVRQGHAKAALGIAAQLRYTRNEYFRKILRVDTPLKFGTVNIPDGLHYMIQPSLKGVTQLINKALSHITAAQHAALRARWLKQGPTLSLHRPKATVPYPQLIKMTRESNALNHLQRIKIHNHQGLVFLTALTRPPQEKEYFALVTPAHTIYSPAIRHVKQAVWASMAILLLMLPIAYWLAGFIVRPVKMLAIEVRKMNDKRYDSVQRVKSQIAEIDDLATIQHDMAHAIAQHTRELEALMDAFIQLIAQAIDDKSPYTGGHCARVPELAMMLAQQANESNLPAFKNFHFSDETQWREFRIGAWLHDCGKITTPEHIVDKATKLEQIYNRIHEIRTRFEVLWRDDIIRYHEQCRETPHEEARFLDELKTRQAKLQEQFAFIASCNIGSESMDDKDIARLNKLSNITWERHFDNRLGLSPIELAQFQEPPSSLPVREKLLDDKPWHKIKRTRNQSYPDHLGIKMKIPDLLSHHGELYNLKIKRGTLTQEDRFKINEHIISTIRMLDTLPLPRELARVPRYASSHHETLDGQGYPRKLIDKDLSIPERIMALADIFEALTAADRPYKRAKPISTAIEILHKMTLNNHIDHDVFELFLRSGVYLKYAHRFLRANQIDAVDLSDYLD
ncbi:HD domain-containing phosphohydrolase [Acidihalobacter prosperus]